MRRRLTRRKKNKRNKQIIMVSTICLLVVMGVGYAAFSTQLSLKAKGNILKKAITPEKLKESVVDSGDGLYKDIYEEGKYTYKGANPNNYITFNNEMWRIISVGADNTVKIVRNDILTNSYWSSTTNCPDGMPFPTDYIGCNKWAYPAALNTYLNEDYYNTFFSNIKNIVTSHNFKIGIINYGQNSLQEIIEAENSNLWEGNIGLITLSDYLNANNNVEQCGNLTLNNTNYSTCVSTNWLYNGIDYWTIIGASVADDTTNLVYYITSNGKIDYDGAGGNNILTIEEYGVRPVVYLTSSITLTGDGTEGNPYVITN